MGNADTIAALASAPGQAGIGVIRVSGPQVETLMKAVVGRVLTPRMACLTKFRDASGSMIDEGIALYFPSPRSYTGEDVLELQGHGGPAVLRLLLRRCLDLGARLAEPGEFTRRAFLNDKLDLTQAEAVADLIEASTEQAARSAMRSLQGEFSSLVHDLQRSLTDLRVGIEATLDFPDDEVDDLHQDRARKQIRSLVAAVGAMLKMARQGSLLRDGLRVTIIGRPNVGKSSIINKLSREEVAIVTAIPGTTRDLIRQSVEIRGLPVHIVDTAGLRRAEDAVEEIGIARTWEAVAQSDVALIVSDLSVNDPEPLTDICARLPVGLRRIYVHNKVDLVGQAHRLTSSAGIDEIWISARTGSGFDLLEDLILKVVEWESVGESVFIARERHVLALAQCRDRLESALEILSQTELVAEELRHAQLALSQLTGEVTSDDLLGEIFSRFCLGK
jgi:tRNA modification GTPase